MCYDRVKCGGNERAIGEDWYQHRGLSWERRLSCSLAPVQGCGGCRRCLLSAPYQLFSILAPTTYSCLVDIFFSSSGCCQPALATALAVASVGSINQSIRSEMSSQAWAIALARAGGDRDREARRKNRAARGKMDRDFDFERAEPDEQGGGQCPKTNHSRWAG